MHCFCECVLFYNQTICSNVHIVALISLFWLALLPTSFPDALKSNVCKFQLQNCISAKNTTELVAVFLHQASRLWSSYTVLWHELQHQHLINAAACRTKKTKAYSICVLNAGSVHFYAFFVLHSPLSIDSSKKNADPILWVGFENIVTFIDVMYNDDNGVLTFDLSIYPDNATFSEYISVEQLWNWVFIIFEKSFKRHIFIEINFHLLA